MSDLSGLPYRPLEFRKSGEPADAAQGEAVLDLARQGAITDVVAMCHGWNNDVADAAKLYADLAVHLAPMLARAAPDRRFGVIGVLWPSKKFADEDLIPGRDERAPGGAASAEGPELDGEALKRRLDRLKGMFDGDDEAALEAAKALVDRLEDSPKAQREFVDRIRSVLPRPSDPQEDASDSFFGKQGDTLLDALKLPLARRTAVAGGGAAAMGDGAGHAAGVGDFFGGVKAAAWRLLNYTTYYQMKERAGAVGRGLNGVLARLRSEAPGLRIHLVGHSFGARAATAAVDGPARVSPSSLALLQGAFSHHGFTARFDGLRDGFFRRVLSEGEVDGPIVVTHTVNDRAVGVAYPIASRLSGDRRLAFGDKDDPFGGIGRNGAVKLAAAEVSAGTLLDAAAAYRFESGKVHNLRADDFIADHGDVANPAVANAVAHALLAR